MSSQSTTTNLFQVVAKLQQSMEDRGLDDEVVDAIIQRGLEVLLGHPEDGRSTVG